MSSTGPAPNPTASDLPPAALGCPFRQAGGSDLGPLAPTSAGAFVAMSKFVVANDKTAEVKEAFRRRPHLVDGQPGFLRMEVWSPLDRPEEIWLVTHWATAEHFDRWHHGHLFHQAHSGIPRGLKLVPGETVVRRFVHICA